MKPYNIFVDKLFFMKILAIEFVWPNFDETLNYLSVKDYNLIFSEVEHGSTNDK